MLEVEIWSVKLATRELTPGLVDYLKEFFKLMKEFSKGDADFLTSVYINFVLHSEKKKNGENGKTKNNGERIKAKNGDGQPERLTSEVLDKLKYENGQISLHIITFGLIHLVKIKSSDRQSGGYRFVPARTVFEDRGEDIGLIFQKGESPELFSLIHVLNEWLTTIPTRE